MNKLEFFKLLEYLEGFEYFFISGLSVAIHSDGKREPNDIDLAMHEKDIDKFAILLGTTASKREIIKGTFKVEDYGFVTSLEDQEVEVTSGYPPIRVKENNFNKLFKLKMKKVYLGKAVYVEPVEELLTQKAFMHRDKDINDLKLLKNVKFNKNLVLELAKDKGKEKEIIEILTKLVTT